MNDMFKAKHPRTIVSIKLQLTATQHQRNEKTKSKLHASI